MTDDRYLLRFDDICPTMNWAVWDQIEAHLVMHGVKPILAVIPDNQDPKLMQDPPRADFWDRVRTWQTRGWAIALHGYQHLYVNKNPGILRLTNQSEFAGIDIEEQREKLTNGLAVFRQQGVRADAWVAPSHSFDRATVAVLAELQMPVISDGLWAWPHADPNRIVWIPQQLWGFQSKPAGIWTICNHHAHWDTADVEEFGRNLAAFAPRMTDLHAVVERFGDRRLTLGDRWTALRTLVWKHRIRPWLSQLYRSFIAKKPRVL